MDTELLRLYQLVHELGDQLAHNQKCAASLQAQTASLKADAAHAVSGFALRRFNTDLAKETFQSELERQSAKTVIENQFLLHENKQLSHLLTEYETTMETIMSQCRNHALAAQRHQLTLTRHYETLLQARESESMSSDLLSSTETAQVLLRLSHHLRRLLRSMAGEPPDPDHDPSAAVPLDVLERLLDDLAVPDTDWSDARETEIARLEHENAALRNILQIDDPAIHASAVSFDPIRDDPARFTAKIVPTRAVGPDPLAAVRPGFWDDPPPPPPPPQEMPVAQGYLQGPAPGPSAGAVLQRALDLQPGMRMGARGQARRSAIIGRGTRRGFGGVPVGDGWQPSPVGPWQGPGGPAMDLMR